MIDIEAQLPTRRFFNAVMDGAHVVVKSQLSSLVNREEGKLFEQVGSLFNLGFTKLQALYSDQSVHVHPCRDRNFLLIQDTLIKRGVYM